MNFNSLAVTVLGLVSFSSTVGFADTSMIRLEAGMKTEGGQILFVKYDSKNGLGSDKTLWCTSQSCYQLETQGGSSSMTPSTLLNLKANLVDSKYPGSQLIYDTEKNQYAVSCGNQTIAFEPMSASELGFLGSNIREGKYKIVTLPEVRKAEYLFQFKDKEEYIYVDSPTRRDYYNFRVFIGPKGKMVEQKVKNVLRYRDGGTTIIMLEDGRSIYSPTPFNTESKPMIGKVEKNDNLKGEELVDLKIRGTNYDLTTLGIPGVPDSEKRTATPCDLLQK